MTSKTLITVAIHGMLAFASPVAVADGSGTGAGSWIGYVAGGNQASGTSSAVTAGAANVASGQGSFVGAGTSNQANGISSLVIGGFDNRATAIDSLVGAGAGNRATGARSVIVGGGYNLASGHWSFIGGGGRESGAGNAGAAAQDNIASAKWAVVAGGMGNRAGTAAAQTGATVSGGEMNQALHSDATVGGGLSNVASGFAATIAGGANNVASGDYSVGLGRRAKTQSAGGAPTVHAGAFAFADSSNFDFNTTAANEFAVRAVGGARLVTAVDGAGTPIAGVRLPAGGGAWAALSDRAAKQDLTVVDPRAVLAKVVAMPVSTWRYRSEVSGARHMGPTAQDFHAAFGLGDSDKSISTVDADGVALAAIQGLQQILQQQDAESEAQAQELAELSARVDALAAVASEVALIKATVARLLRQHSARMVKATLRD